MFILAHKLEKLKESAYQGYQKKVTLNQKVNVYMESYFMEEEFYLLDKAIKSSIAYTMKTFC